jgi:hypothetical protein
MTYVDDAARPTYLWPGFRRGSVHSRNVSKPCACNLETEADPSARAAAIFTPRSGKLVYESRPAGSDLTY